MLHAPRGDGGAANYRRGDYAAAEADLRQAIRAAGIRESWITLGHVQAAQRHYTEAFASFLQALDVARSYNELGEAAVRNGDLADGLRWFEAAAEAAPSYFEQAEKNRALTTEKLRRMQPAPLP